MFNNKIRKRNEYFFRNCITVKNKTHIEYKCLWFDDFLSDKRFILRCQNEWNVLLIRLICHDNVKYVTRKHCRDKLNKKRANEHVLVIGDVRAMIKIIIFVIETFLKN